MNSKYVIVLAILTMLNEIHSKIRNYDNFDIEAMLGNPAKSLRFFECVKNEATCTTEDKDIKRK